MLAWVDVAAPDLVTAGGSVGALWLAREIIGLFLKSQRASGGGHGGKHPEIAELKQRVNYHSDSIREIREVQKQHGDRLSAFGENAAKQDERMIWFMDSICEMKEMLKELKDLVVK